MASKVFNMGRVGVVALAAFLIAACGTAGAPPPGELVQESCNINELLVCPEKTGSRINKEYGTCYCEPAERL